LPRGTANLPSIIPENNIVRGKEEIKRKERKKGTRKVKHTLQHPKYTH
jgi:hypothetical protein